MRKNAMVIAAMMISTIMFAQGNRNGAFGPRPSRDNSINELGISDAQRTSMENINKKYATKQAEALKALRDQQDKEITALLTPEQKAKREQLTKEREEARKLAQAKSVADHDARMKSTLLLSNEQAGKLHNEDQAFRTKMEALRKDAASREASMDQIKKIRTEHEAAVQSILNDEQFKKWSSLNDGPGPDRNMGQRPGGGPGGRGQFDRQRAFGDRPSFDDNRFRDQRGPGKGQRGPQRDRGDRDHNDDQDRQDFRRRG